MTAKQEECIRLYTELGTYTAVAARLRVSRSAVTKTIKRAHAASARDGKLAVSLPAPNPAPRPMSRDSFRADFDPVAKALSLVRTAVLKLTDPDKIYTDSQFRTMQCAGVPPTCYRATVDLDEFRQYRFRKGDKLFWAAPETKQWAIETIAQVRDI